MDVALWVLGGFALLLIGFALIGGPMVVADWGRRRREAVIARQITLTDALDAQFGALVAPVVTRPLFGPWMVQIAVPWHSAAILARMLATVDEVFSNVDGTNPSAYRVLLRVTPEVQREARSGSPVGLRADTWATAPGR